ncbi:MAG TPA: hypothetical protein VKE51_38805, partial [Vicinamibacterales bacterium]|nr:hypothetical protein [Vicinamibacterales bacterium]
MQGFEAAIGIRPLSHRFEGKPEIVRGMKTLFRVLFETAVEDALDGRGHLTIGRRVARVVVQNRRHRLDGRPPSKRTLAEKHLVENETKGKDVAPVVSAAAPNLFGRRVSNGPRHSRRERVDVHGRDRGVSFFGGRDGVLLRRLRQSKIEDFHRAVARDEDVLRLQVAVSDALQVGRRQTSHDLKRVIEALPERKRAARRGIQSFPQVLAVEQLHG